MGHNSARGDNSDKKKIQVSYFFTRNPYMKIQNPSFKFFSTDGHMDARTDKPKAICSPLFLSWGHKKKWWEPQYLANPPNLILSGVTHYTFAKKLSHLSNLVSQIF